MSIVTLQNWGIGKEIGWRQLVGLRVTSCQFQMERAHVFFSFITPSLINETKTVYCHTFKSSYPHSIFISLFKR